MKRATKQQPGQSPGECRHHAKGRTLPGACSNRGQSGCQLCIMSFLPSGESQGGEAGMAQVGLSLRGQNTDTVK